MGFSDKQTVYALEFDGNFEGLVVKTTVPAMGVVLDIQKTNNAVASLMGKDATDLTPDDLAVTAEHNELVMSAFTESLVSWNVEDAEGAEIPATAEGLRKVSSTLGNHIVQTWLEFVTGGVTGPKDEPSSSGKPPLEASLPMETLSPSRAS